MEEQLFHKDQWNLGFKWDGRALLMFTLTALRRGGSTALDLKVTVWKVAVSLSLINYE